MAPSSNTIALVSVCVSAGTVAATLSMQVWERNRRVREDRLNRSRDDNRAWRDRAVPCLARMRRELVANLMLDTTHDLRQIVDGDQVEPHLAWLAPANDAILPGLEELVAAHPDKEVRRLAGDAESAWNDFTVTWTMVAHLVAGTESGRPWRSTLDVDDLKALALERQQAATAAATALIDRVHAVIEE